MLNKVIGVVLLVIITGVLIWGGVNRTLAKTNEGSNSVGGGQGRYHDASDSELSVHGENGDTGLAEPQGFGRRYFDGSAVAEPQNQGFWFLEANRFDNAETYSRKGHRGGSINFP
jgi:hypothetical protein